MKKIVYSVVFALCLFTSANVFAGTNLVVEEDMPKVLRIVSEKVKSSLQDIEIDFEMSVKILFTVNSDGEMAILDVRTKNSDLKNQIKSSLNFSKVGDAGLIVGKTYSINIKLMK